MSVSALLNADGTTNRVLLPNVMNYRGLWDSAVIYNKDDIVSDTFGNWWVASVVNTYISPANYPTLSTWQPIGNSNIAGSGSAGVATVTSGNAGITIGGTVINPTVSNAGVLSVTAGTGITNVGTATAPNLQANLVSVVGGTNITTSTASGTVTVSAPTALVNPLGGFGVSSSGGKNGQRIDSRLIGTNGASDMAIAYNTALASPLKWTGVIAISENTAFAVANGGYLTKLTAGAPASTTVIGSLNSYTGLSQNSTQTIFLTTSGGNVYTCSSPYSSLVSLAVPIASFSCVSVSRGSDYNDVFIGTTAGVMYFSADAGVTWAPVPTITSNWLSVVNQWGTGVYCDANNIYYSTGAGAVSLVANKPAGATFGTNCLTYFLYANTTQVLVTTQSGTVYVLTYATGTWQNVTTATGVTGTICGAGAGGFSGAYSGGVVSVATPGGYIYTVTQSNFASANAGTTYGEFITDPTTWTQSAIKNAWSCVAVFGCMASNTNLPYGTKTYLIAGSSSVGGDGYLYGTAVTSNTPASGTTQTGTLLISSERKTSIYASDMAIRTDYQCQTTSGGTILMKSTNSIQIAPTISLGTPTNANVYTLQPYIQSGVTSTTTASSGSFTVTLPVTYTSATSYRAMITPQVMTTAGVQDVGFSVNVYIQTAKIIVISFNNNIAGYTYQFQWATFGN